VEDVGVEAEAFADVARRFVAAIDAREGRPSDELLLALYPLLCELCFRAAQLPDVNPGEGERGGCPFVDGWERRYHSLKAQLGEYDLYWEVFDPVERDDDDPINGVLSDDLADIYRDVSDGLGPQGETIPAHVIWSWRFTYYSHWGHHALGAARAIHALVGYHDLGDEGPEEDGVEGA
jgi:hypothetical protein